MVWKIFSIGWCQKAEYPGMGSILGTKRGVKKAKKTNAIPVEYKETILAFKFFLSPIKCWTKETKDGKLKAPIQVDRKKKVVKEEKTEKK